MTKPPSPLFPLFRSKLMTDVTTLVFTAETEYTIQDLAESLSVDRKNVTTVVDTLTESGILTSTQIGRSRFLTANASAPFYEPLRQLLTIVQGPPIVVGKALSSITDIKAAYIYGSWASRANGNPGAPPVDVDVVVLTEQRQSSRQRVEIMEALEAASDTLRRPVNPIFATINQWNTSADAFLSSIKSGDLIEALPFREEAPA